MWAASGRGRGIVVGRSTQSLDITWTRQRLRTRRTSPRSIVSSGSTHMRSAAVIVSLALCAAAATLHAANENPIGESTALVAFALDKLRTYHVNRSRLDWSTVEVAAMEKAKAARSNGELYDIIDGVIRDLGSLTRFS